MLPSVPTIEVLGLPFSELNYSQTADAVAALSKTPGPKAVAFCATHLPTEAASNPEFKSILQKFNLLVPDGMPIRWAMNLQGSLISNRVYGPYFMKKMIGYKPGQFKHFLFGGTEQCLDELKTKIHQESPNTQIVGTLSPAFGAWSEADLQSYANTINASEADFIWVALGGVKQETWIIQNQHRFNRGVFLAVGDAFELLAGRRPFAPLWMQNAGLTWLYRLYQEPKRMWKRYLKYNFIFLYKYLKHDLPSSYVFLTKK